MNLRNLIPPVLAAGFDRVLAKSWAASSLAWRRGDDVVDGPKNRLSQPYAQSAWVHAAVNHVAGEISGRPLCFYSADQEYEDPAFSAWWAAPALGPQMAGGFQPRLSQADVLRDLAAWAKLEGEFFLLFDDSWLLASLRRKPGTLTPFIIARPSRMRLIVQAGVIEGYEYTDAAGRRSVYLPEQVIHWKAFNPYDDYRGLGDLQSAQIAAESSFYTGVYVRDLMRNNGDQGYIVIGKTGPASPEQQEQITADLRAKRQAIQRGVAKDIFLTGDITVDRPKEQAAGSELLQGKGLSQQEVFVAFGVPPSMAEVKASYSVGKDSDYYQLIIRTCMPLGGQIASALSSAATRMAGRQIEAELEWDDHPVMVEVRNGRLETAQKLWASGWSWEAINDYLDLDIAPFPGWEKAYIPFSIVEVDTSGSKVQPEPAADPAMAETEQQRRGAELPEITQLKALFALRSRSKAAESTAAKIEADTLAVFTCNHGCDCVKADLGAEGSAKEARPAREIALWRTHMKQRREAVSSYKSAFGRVLMQARIETLRKIEAKYQPKKASPGANPDAVIKAAADDLLFNLSTFSQAFQDAMRNVGKSALDLSGAQLMAELGKDDPFTFAPADVLDFLNQRENKLAGVPQSVFERIRSNLVEGIDAGESTAQLAARVKRQFNTIGDTEAQRIALTETAAAYGFGRQQAMVKAGVQYKAWLTSGNANVRTAHQEAGLSYPPDGGIPVDEPFIVDGEELMHPGDAAGSPGNTINCHCVSIPVTAPADV